MADALAFPFGDAPSGRQIAVRGIMRGGLVRHRIGPDAARQHFRKYLRGIAEQADRDGFAAAMRGCTMASASSIEVGALVHIAGLQSLFDAAILGFDRDHAGAGKRCGQWLRAAHAAQAAGEDPFAGQAAAEMLPAHFDERFVGALNDALAADINPGTRRHLAVHHQAQPIECGEMFPRWPNAAPGCCWRSARAARPHGCGTHPPACPIARAGFHRRRASSVRRRWHRSNPSCARRGRCRHRPRVPPAFPPPRDRGCSSACAAALRSARFSRVSSVLPRAARTSRALRRKALSCAKHRFRLSGVFAALLSRMRWA